MSLDPAFVARMLASLPDNEATRRLCVELVSQLGAQSPTPSAIDSPETPENLDRLLATLAGGGDPQKAAPASPTVAGGSIVQSVTGAGSSAINSGNAYGGSQTIAPVGNALEVSNLQAESPPSSPVRILFLSASPRDSTPLRLDEEVREIDRALSGAQLGDRFELLQKWAVRTVDLQSHLLRTKPQIMHFSGHGSPQSAIILEDENRRSRAVPAQQLARLLGQFSSQLRCVVLNACYSEDQAEAIATTIECVVGMSAEVADRAAVHFSTSFYQGLAYGRSVRASFDLACSDLDFNRLRGDSVPRLIAPRQGADSLVFARPKGAPK